jgi:hypothetical protein
MRPQYARNAAGMRPEFDENQTMNGGKTLRGAGNERQKGLTAFNCHQLPQWVECSFYFFTFLAIGPRA